MPTRRLPNGTIITDDNTEELRVIGWGIQNAYRAEVEGVRRYVLSFTVHGMVRGGTPAKGVFHPGQVSLFRDHGYRPSLMLAVVVAEGGIHEALEYLVNNKPGTEIRRGTINRVEMTMTRV